MEKLPSQKRREAYFKALGIVTEKDFAEWQRTGVCPVVVIHSLPAQIPQSLLKEPKISSRSWKPKVSCMFWKPRKSRLALSPDYEGGCGYTPLEACLRAVLAVLGEKR